MLTDKSKIYRQNKHNTCSKEILVRRQSRVLADKLEIVKCTCNLLKQCSLHPRLVWA